MDSEDLVAYLTEDGLSLDELTLLDGASPDGELHAPDQRARLWHVIRCAARDGRLTDSDARWIARVTAWADSPIAESVREFARRRDADARDREYQTRPDPLPAHLAGPPYWRP